MSTNVSADTEKKFKPSRALIKIYWIYSLACFIPEAVCFAVVTYYNVVVGAILYTTLVAVPAALLAYWIPRFYRSVKFSLENDHAYAEFGVWWIVRKRVPYNLISEVKIRQGPLQRRLGLACVGVYTPATGAARPELTFFQLDVDKAKEVASKLRVRVGILSSKERKVIEKEILTELRAIRKILEELLKRVGQQ